MKKCGILTFHNAPNYGAALQAYALCKTVNSLGYNCEIVDYRCESIINRERRIDRKGNVIKRLKKILYFNRYIRKKINGHDKFIKNSGFLSEKSYTRNTLVDANSEYSVFISGSDQVWNLNITHDLSFFLDFADSTKGKMAYASSAGSIWNSEDLNTVTELILQYKHIGVREKELEVLMRDALSLNVETVADPTLLLQTEDYRKIAISPKEKNYVLVYYPKDDLLDAAMRYAKRNGSELVVIGAGKGRYGNRMVNPSSPDEWIGYIMNANAIFTNSYHGLLFSLYFEKKVWTSYKGEKSSRQRTIIEYFDLEKCYIWNDPDLNNEINYTYVNEQINSYRKHSIGYLQQSLVHLY